AVEVFCLKEGVMDKVASTRTPQPVLALVEMLDVPIETFANSSFMMMVIDAQNPGNVGSLLRCAQAAGADGFIVGTTTQGSGAEFYNPKCIRATAGAVFKIPVAIVKEPNCSLELLGSWGIMRLGAYPAGSVVPAGGSGGVDSSGSVGLYDVDLKKPLCWVMGNESVGLAPSI
ncbi:TrmH family RNA methyltransferase, partial [mine drainage metagenome]